ncbi:hypothetical protein [Methylobacterium sp. SyP6R]|uniref:hypothetical protein n=1 Tax=Methylobacterium sp. SyP6R TaxID=2718876 RepID=UPI001F28F782|nr:hypothetical protein [Methylobacterium sp. SyP6R]MCF4130135.1 hypothetical protein [Methylobacterium sp. SyP6R]
MAAKNFVKSALRIATLAVVLVSAMPSLVVAASDDAEKLDLQNKNRSNFQYHDGRAEERRPYRRPSIDADPRDLKIEELTERLNGLEERIEKLERQSINPKRVQ